MRSNAVNLMLIVEPKRFTKKIIAKVIYGVIMALSC